MVGVAGGLCNGGIVAMKPGATIGEPVEVLDGPKPEEIVVATGSLFSRADTPWRIARDLGRAAEVARSRVQGITPRV